jgi:hypothetical protein
MDLKQTSAWRSRAGKIGAVLCLLLLLSVLDALVARLREPASHFSGLRGDTIPITSPVGDQSENIQDLSYKSSPEGIILRFEAIQKGFWFGGALWNGVLEIGPNAPAGRYTVTVQSPKGTQRKGGSRFYVEVFRDLAELQKHSLSFFLSILGINPWQAALFFLPWVLMTFGAVFYLSSREDRLLLEEGKAEVYRVRKVENEEEIFFGLGSGQGIGPGQSMVLINPQGVVVGSIVVRDVFEDHAMARVDLGWKVIPGFIVSR